MSIDPDAIVAVLNPVALLSALAIIIVGLMSLVRHLLLYVRTSTPIDVLLKRDIVLFSGLAILGLESVILRALGVTPGDLTGWPRLLYAVQADLVILISLTYWAWVELRDVQDAKKR